MVGFHALNTQPINPVLFITQTAICVAKVTRLRHLKILSPKRSHIAVVDLGVSLVLRPVVDMPRHLTVMNINPEIRVGTMTILPLHSLPVQTQTSAAHGTLLVIVTLGIVITK